MARERTEVRPFREKRKRLTKKLLLGNFMGGTRQALRGVARDGVNLDTRLFNHGFVHPAQEPKSGLVTGPIKLTEAVI